MNVKLTLKLDEGVIKKAKIYAKKNQKSLSELVENYFKILTEETDEEKLELPPVTSELSGVIKASEIENYQSEYTDYLRDKYQ